MAESNKKRVIDQCYSQMGIITRNIEERKQQQSKQKKS